jgi:hypothetical protein
MPAALRTTLAAHRLARSLRASLTRLGLIACSSVGASPVGALPVGALPVGALPVGALSVLSALSLSACGSGFPGRLPPEPVWVSLSPELINPSDRVGLYATGSTRGSKRIDQRRAVAESAALEALRATLVERTLALMESGNKGLRPTPPPGEVKEVELLLTRLPLQQAASIEDRYFDAERDAQHALARLTFELLKQLIVSQPVDGAVKAAAIEYTGYAFLSLRP